MKHNIFAFVLAAVLTISIGFGFIGCKKEEASAPETTTEQGAAGTETPAEKAEPAK